MAYTPGYEETHLLMAAIRVLAFKDGRSPTPDDVARLLGVSVEKVLILVHELRGRGILKVFESPFEVRLDPGDPVPIESLPKGDDAPSIVSELSEFHTRAREKKKEMEKMFRGGEADRRRRERVSRLEKEFQGFKPKPGALDGLFKPSSKDPPAEDEKEE